MRFLADESCDSCMIRALQDSGHDVVTVAAGHRGSDDATVIRLAADTARILLTEDKDFGQLVFASCHGHGVVILLQNPRKDGRGGTRPSRNPRKSPAFANGGPASTPAAGVLQEALHLGLP